MRYCKITTDDEVTVCTVPDEAWGYRPLRELIDGWLEAVTVFDGHAMYLDEEGKWRGLRPNAIATALAMEAGIPDVIVGLAIIVGPADSEGADTPVTDTFVEHLRANGIVVREETAA